MKNCGLLLSILFYLVLCGYCANAQSKLASQPGAMSHVAASAHLKANRISTMGIANIAIPSLIYPANGATGIPIIPQFKMQTVVGGLTYYLDVATDQYFDNIVSTNYWKFNSPTDSVYSFRWDPGVTNPGNFTNNTNYYWRVEVADSSGQNISGWSQQYSYTTTSASASVSQPVLSLPTNYATDSWIGTTFYWLPSSGATQYQVIWSTSFIFDGFSYHWSDGNETSLVENLKPSTTYYWKVIAYNDGTISQFSPTGVFYTSSIDTLTATSGSFDDGSGTDNYADGLDIRWLIAPPTAKQIVTLVFFI